MADNIIHITEEIEDLDIPYGEKEPIEEFCPTCGSNKMVKYTQQTSPYDYDTIVECLSCGTTQST